jgi:hypothetical protein
VRESRCAAARLAAGLMLLGFGAAGVTRAGLPGYFEWVLWKETQAVGATAPGEPDLEWVTGPYAKLLDCEKDRDRLATIAAAGQAGTVRSLGPGVVSVSRPGGTMRIRLLCIPDSVNPREDRRWR